MREVHDSRPYRINAIYPGKSCNAQPCHEALRVNITSASLHRYCPAYTTLLANCMTLGASGCRVHAALNARVGLLASCLWKPATPRRSGR
ncbi:hypothetical protein PUN4_280152 [Paraburkholderia unamae]|nr:hypothetical protein PUN4_280152 [Paraburkholderia unamae]